MSATAGNAQATVTFTAPSSNGGSTITGYTVSGGGTDSNAGSTALSHLITGLTNGTAYTFTVKATNAVGNSNASAASNSVTPVSSATAPGAPTNLGATSVGTSSVALSWLAPASNGGSALIDYLIQYKVTASSSYSTFSHTPSTTTAQTISSLVASTSYSFQVSAVNSVGTSTAASYSTSTVSNGGGGGGGGGTNSPFALVNSYHYFTDPFTSGYATSSYVQNSSSVVLDVPGEHDSTITAPSSMTSGYDAITVEFWMMDSQSMGGCCDINDIIKGPGIDIQGYLSSPGAIYFQVARSYNGAYMGGPGVLYSHVLDNQWHYFAFTYDKRYITLYVDGHFYNRVWLDNVTTKIGPMLDDNDNAFTQIIAPNTNNFNNDGNPVQDRRITLAVLTPEQIQQNFERGHGYSVVYVSPSGVGAGSTIGNPTNLTSALSSITGGKELILAPGEYTGSSFTLNSISTTNLSNILIMGQAATSGMAVIDGTSTISNTPYVTLRNLAFTNATSTVLSVLNSTSTTLDGVRVAGNSNGVSVSNSTEFRIQNSEIDVPGVSLALSNSPNSEVRNNTIVHGTSAVSYTNSSDNISLINNIFDKQTAESVLISDGSELNYVGDGNLYNPLSGTALQITTSDYYQNGLCQSPAITNRTNPITDTYTTAQVLNKNLSRAWFDYAYETNCYANYADHYTGLSPEAKSTSFTPVYINGSSGDYRLDRKCHHNPNRCRCKGNL